ncbi:MULTISPECIES: winged helix-turn-helix domain-containing protein [Yersinia]|uniref:Transcriptional regulator CadC n=1 Tax=Yersinia mollaretii TaxID=33060 RepID=A0AA36LPP4_YERMO|nr:MULTISPECIES: hypothetical protein [Yersinia]MDA5527858.1 hypothetical protein [Yersinia mollaretii]MDA5537411.1 hypothetical protein [Yersinia mollaretii]MDN0111785.1 hypothetical protein [Yersinia mollaretii]MDR7875564.1 hypothetical protein [Yersinia mollaretii]NIL05313.1 hypothetical protein [Yersinia mollaretii]
MKYHLNTKSQFEQEAPILSGNKLTFPIKNKEIILSKNQAKLINCLLNKTNEKSDIIKFIWGEGIYKSKNNSYNQLIHQTRALFIDEGFSPNFIMTIPRYGVCLNKNKLISNNPKKYRSANMLNDHATCI